MERLKNYVIIGLLRACMLSMLLFASCQKDAWFGPVNPVQNDSLNVNGSALYLIGCEGNFQFGNASLSVLNLDSATIGNEVYAASNGQPLGDVLQSITIIDSLIYLVVNNSNKIVAIKPISWKEQFVIENIPSPRFLLELNDESLLATSFGAAQISIIDTKTKRLKGTIETPYWTEHIVKSDQWIIATSPSDSSVLLIDSTDLHIHHTLKLPAPPKNLIKIAGRHHVITGNTEITSCFTIQESNFIEAFTVPFEVLAVAGNSIGYWFLTSSEIIHTDMLGQITKRINHGMQTPYAIYADEENLLSTDVKDYLSDGEVLHYDLNMNMKGKYKSKLIPQFIAVWKR